MTTRLPVQRRQVLLAHSNDSAALRRWAIREGADYMPVYSSTIEYSDNPRSRLGRDAAVMCAIRTLKSMDDVDTGLLVIETNGLPQDVVNRLSNTAHTAGWPCMRMNADELEFPILFKEIPKNIDARHVGPTADGKDIVFIGDIHGCSAELDELMSHFGMNVTAQGYYENVGRQDIHFVFVGDLVDRGPDPVGVIRRVHSLMADGRALCVMGNHDQHLMRFLRGDKVTKEHGMGATQEIMAPLEKGHKDRILSFLEALPHQLVLDNGNVVVAHAGCPERHLFISCERTAKENVFGTMLGRDEDGLPMRWDWAAEYQGEPWVIQGHVPVLRATDPNTSRCIMLDTGCAFGNALTAMVWSTKEFVSVPAHRDYTNGHPTAQKLARAREADEAQVNPGMGFGT